MAARAKEIESALGSSLKPPPGGGRGTLSLLFGSLVVLLATATQYHLTAKAETYGFSMLSSLLHPCKWLNAFAAGAALFYAYRAGRQSQHHFLLPLSRGA